MTSKGYETDMILSLDGFGHSCDFFDGGGVIACLSTSYMVLLKDV